MAEDLINKDTKKELSGLLVGLLFMVGIVVSIISIPILYGSLSLGILVWLIGMGLIGLTLRMNLKSTTSGGLRRANIIMKIVMMSILFIVFILAMVAYFAN